MFQFQNYMRKGTDELSTLPSIPSNGHVGGLCY